MILQSLWCDHEVEKSDLHRELREIVRVAEFSGDVESKIAGVLNGIVPQFDAPHSTLEERGREGGKKVRQRMLGFKAALTDLV